MQSQILETMEEGRWYCLNDFINRLKVTDKEYLKAQINALARKKLIRGEVANREYVYTKCNP